MVTLFFYIGLIINYVHVIFLSIILKLAETNQNWVKLTFVLYFPKSTYNGVY